MEHTLSEFVENMAENARTYKKAFPKMAEAAEAVNLGFQTFLYQCIKIDKDNKAMYVTGLLCLSAYISWVKAFSFTSSGNGDSGWAEMRRAIEFSCYSTKTFDNVRRAEAWMNQRNNKKAQRLFASSCAIPFCYISKEKYSYLRALLVAYETSNYFGAHGNIETIAFKYDGSIDDCLTISFIDNVDGIISATPLIILLGYRMLNAFYIVLGKAIFDQAPYRNIAKYISEKIRDSRIESKQMLSEMKLPSKIIASIYADDITYIDTLFDEMIKREEQRKIKKVSLCFEEEDYTI